MRVPLLDLSEQYRLLADPIRAEIDDILRTQQFILGPAVEKFERAVCHYTGAKQAVGVSSGTDALLAILMAMGIGPGDAVITTAYTFFATAGCIARLGATPLFVDIDGATLNLSPNALTDFLEKRCRLTTAGTMCGSLKVRAIVPVHLFGLCCEMNAILEIARRYQLPVIEDAAQAIGAQYPGTAGARQAGTMGLAGYFSFYPSKNLGAVGDAGLIVTDDDEFAAKLRSFRQHGMEPRYYHHVIGGNFRLDAIQAAVLSVKLPHLDGWAEARHRAADVYRAEFQRAGLEKKIALPAEPWRGKVRRDHVYHQFVIRAPRREALRDLLGRHEVGTAIYYPLGLHEQKCFEYLGYKHGDLPETERAAEETVALPIYPEISPEAQEYVVEKIAEFYR